MSTELGLTRPASQAESRAARLFFVRKVLMFFSSMRKGLCFFPTVIQKGNLTLTMSNNFYSFPCRSYLVPRVKLPEIRPKAILLYSLRWSAPLTYIISACMLPHPYKKKTKVQITGARTSTNCGSWSLRPNKLSNDPKVWNV